MLITPVKQLYTLVIDNNRAMRSNAVTIIRMANQIAEKYPSAKLKIIKG